MGVAIIAVPLHLFHRSMRSKTAESHGFTLVELMVVIALLSLVVTITVPRLRSSLFSDQLKSATRSIIGLVIESGQDAFRNQKSYIMTFDMSNNQISSEFDEGKLVFQDQAEKTKKTYTLPDSVSLVGVSSFYGGNKSMGQAVLTFSRKGYVDKTFVYLRSDDGRDMTIKISPFLGTIQAVDSYVELIRSDT